MFQKLSKIRFSKIFKDSQRSSKIRSSKIPKHDSQRSSMIYFCKLTKPRAGRLVILRLSQRLCKILCNSQSFAQRLIGQTQREIANIISKIQTYIANIICQTPKINHTESYARPNDKPHTIHTPGPKINHTIHKPDPKINHNSYAISKT